MVNAKTYMLIGMGIFAALILIALGVVAAGGYLGGESFSISNSKNATSEMSPFIKSDINPKYGVITLTGSTKGKIMETALTENTELCILNCKQHFKVTLYEDGTLFDNIEYDVLKGSRTTLKNINITYKTGEEEYFVDVPDTFKEECLTISENKTDKEIKYCSNVTLTTKKEKQIRNIYSQYNGEVLPAGNYEFDITGEINQGQTVDVILVKNDKRYTEWATWTSGYDVGLVYYWGLDEATGLNAVDNISGMPLVLMNTRMWNFSHSCKHGNACFELNNTNFYANTSAAISGGGSGAFTISFWAQRTKVTASGYEPIISTSMKNAATYPDGEFVASTGSNTYSSMFRIQASNGAEGGSAYTLDKWVHVVYIVSNGVPYKEFINGSNRYNSSGNIAYTNFPTGKPLSTFLTASGYTPVTWIMIDEIAIWNRTLSNAEIDGLYNAGAGIFYEPPAGSTQCTPSANANWEITDAQVCNGVNVGTGSGNITITSTGNLTLVNGANVTTMVLNFVGSGDKVIINRGCEVKTL